MYFRSISAMLMLFCNRLSLGVLLSLSLFLGTIDQSWGQQSLNQQLNRAFQQLEHDQQLKHGVVSLTVLNARTGAVIFAKNEELGLASASTLKTVTSAAAFHILGADYQYQTDVLYTGKVLSDGTLDGDILI